MPDPVDLTDVLTAGPPSDPALDVRGLRAQGIARLQDLAGNVWTDYNLHDPGLTILEVLCFALTDLAYRISLPIEDLIASSSHSTGCGVEEQPLFVGPRILGTAPVTEADLRRFLCDRIPDLRNAWLLPSGDVPGVFQVVLQPFWVGNEPEPQDDPQPHRVRSELEPQEKLAAKLKARRDAASRRMREQARTLLAANRPLGMDYAAITTAPTRRYRIALRATISDDAEVDATVAALLEAADTAANPPPRRRDPSVMMKEGIPPDEVFDGPSPCHGIILSESLAPLSSTPDSAQVLAALSRVPDILSIEAFSLLGPLDNDTEDAAIPPIPVIDRSTEAIKQIVLRKAGATQQGQPDEVRARLFATVARRRWMASEDAMALRQSEYNRVPLGRHNRRLARYRSIQHFFPEIYGVGAFGFGSSILDKSDEAPALTKRRRKAAIRQLKAYLLMFEQRLTDSLSQLDHIAPLLSFRPLATTYFSQSLVHPGPEIDADDPPDIAPLLGGPEPVQGIGAVGAGQWYRHYRTELEKISKATDDVALRRIAALDHMLARFNIRFPTQAPAQLSRPQAGIAQCTPVEARRRFLADIERLSARRGTGPDVGPAGKGGPKADPARPVVLPGCALLEQVRHKSGLPGDLLLVEHVLLREVATRDGIGDLQIGTTFHIDPPVALKLATADGNTVVHGVFAGFDVAASHQQLIGQALELLGDPGAATIGPPGSYRPFLRYTGPDKSIEIIERFPNFSTAERVVATLSADADGLRARATALPPAFADRSVSVFAETPDSACPAPNEIQSRVERELAAAIPAHLARVLYWQDSHEIAKTHELIYDWLSDPCLRTPASRTAGRALKNRIEQAWRCAFLRRRAAIMGDIR